MGAAEGDHVPTTGRYFRRLVEPPLKGLAFSATASSRMSMPLDEPMRAAPTPTLGGSLSIWEGTTVVTTQSIATNYSSTDRIEVDLNTSSGLTTNRLTTVIRNSGGYIDLSAEL